MKPATTEPYKQITRVATALGLLADKRFLENHSLVSIAYALKLAEIDGRISEQEISEAAVIIVLKKFVLEGTEPASVTAAIAIAETAWRKVSDTARQLATAASVMELVMRNYPTPWLFRKEIVDSIVPFIVPRFRESVNKLIKSPPWFWIAVQENPREFIVNDVRRNENSMTHLTPELMDFVAVAADLHVPGTGIHLANVSKVSQIIAKHMGEDIEVAYTAGYLHDVGKLAVARPILNKPGKLELHEKHEIVKHPYYSWIFCKALGFENTDVALAVSCHHERIDGSGYPYGYSGNKLNRIARIVAVADVITALLEEKPYKPAYTLDDAIRIIAGETGLCPEVVAAAREVQEEIWKAVLSSGNSVTAQIREGANNGNFIRSNQLLLRS